MTTVRMEFFEVDGKRAVEVLSGGKEFRGTLWCEAEDLTKTITDKMALLKTAGVKQKVKTIGKKLKENIYYLDITLTEWEELSEAISSARQRRLAQSI